MDLCRENFLKYKALEIPKPAELWNRKEAGQIDFCSKATCYWPLTFSKTHWANIVEWLSMWTLEPDCKVTGLFSYLPFVNLGISNSLSLICKMEPIIEPNSQYCVKGQWVSVCALGTQWMLSHGAPIIITPVSCQGGTSEIRDMKFCDDYTWPCKFKELLVYLVLN